jgi:hypothetical protein
MMAMPTSCATRYPQASKHSKNEGIALSVKGKKRSKLRGGVESDRNVPDKSIEHERGEFQSLAEQYETTLPHRFRDAHGMQTCHIAGLSPMRDAKLQMAPFTFAGR